MPGDGAVSPRSAVRCGLGVREGPRPGRCEGGGCPAWSAAGGRARMGAAAGGAGCLGALRRPGRRRARRCAPVWAKEPGHSRSWSQVLVKFPACPVGGGFPEGITCF